MLLKLVTLGCAILATAACKPRTYNQGAGNEANPASLPDSPGLSQGGGFAYGSEQHDAAYRAHLENQKKKKTGSLGK